MTQLTQECVRRTKIRRPDGGRRPSKWIDRLVMLAAFRQRCLFLRLARRGRQRALEHRPERSGGFHQPALRGRHARPRNRCPDAGRHRAPDRFHADPPGRPVGRHPHGRGAVGLGRHGDGPQASVRLRLPPALVRSRERRGDGQDRLQSGRARSTGAGGDRGRCAHRGFHRLRGSSVRLRPRLFGRPRRSFRCRPVESQGARPRHGARRDAPLLARLDRAFRYVENAVAGRSQAILDHATRHDPSGDGRPRGCADHQPSRGACRRLELGLSLLLAAGRDVHARCFRQCGLHR